MKPWLACVLLLGLTLAGCADDAPSSDAKLDPDEPPQATAPPTTAPPREPTAEPQPEPVTEPQPEPEPESEPPAEPEPEPEAETRDPFVVIAVVDSGINVYHEAFRRPELVAHPSTYIDGYPKDASAVSLTFGTGAVDDLARADAVAWDAVKSNGQDLYWFPGTNIIGAKSHTPAERAILDDNGHGTGSASVAAGTYGSCPDCLLVFIEGLGQYEWALEQPWIDIVTNSYGPCAPGVPGCAARSPATPPLVFSGPTKDSSEAGQVVLFSSGNGHLNAYDVPQLTYAHAYTGPDWVVTVGAVFPGDQNSIAGAGKPVDLASYGRDWPAADEASSDGEIRFSGTSCATPIAAGVFGQVLLEARRALGDVQGGHQGGIVAEGTPVAGSPFLDDGILTRAELYELVTKTAVYPSAQGGWIYPTGVPATPADALHMGWGVVDANTAQAGVDWLLGGSIPASKPVAEAWMPVDSEIRQSIWGSWNGGEPGLRTAVTTPDELHVVFASVLAAALHTPSN